MNPSLNRARRNYLFVYVALIILLAATVGGALLPLGPFHVIVAIGIAVAKAVLVAIFFMHLGHTGNRTVMLIFGSIVILIVLIVLTGIDYATRINGLPLVH